MELYFTKGSRARALAIIVIAVMAVFVVRLFYIQIIRHNDYVAQADSVRVPGGLPRPPGFEVIEQ